MLETFIYFHTFCVLIARLGGDCMNTVEVPNREICPKDANGIASSVDPDQMPPRGAMSPSGSSRSHLIWVRTVYQGLYAGLKVIYFS